MKFAHNVTKRPQVLAKDLPPSLTDWRKWTSAPFLISA
jgi:hypothetical protein